MLDHVWLFLLMNSTDLADNDLGQENNDLGHFPCLGSPLRYPQKPQNRRLRRVLPRSPFTFPSKSPKIGASGGFCLGSPLHVLKNISKSTPPTANHNTDMCISFEVRGFA